MLKGYKKYIAENRSIIYTSTLIAFIIRLLYFYKIDERTSSEYTDSLLWEYISPFLTNVYLSYIGAFLASMGLAFYVLWLCDKYALIRVRTALPYAFFVFFTACFPFFAELNPTYLSLFFVLVSFNILYGSYQKENVSDQSFRISFLLTVGSLIDITLLLYIPLFWLGLAIVRSFRFKAVLASLLGVGMVLWILVFIMYLLGITDSLLVRFEDWKEYSPPVMSYDYLDKWIFYAINTLLGASIIFSYYTNSYKDKIQVRTYISFVNVLFFFSLILSVVFFHTMGVSFLIMLLTLSIIAAHYFALIEYKGGVYFLIAVILVYLMFFFYQLSLIR